MTEPESVRSQMTEYWSQHSEGGATVEVMMLDSFAKDIDESERSEILQLLPEFKGKKVLELGAGIGRFTGALAKEASHVTAIDFIEKFIIKNKELHNHYGNVDFVQADVTTLEYPDNSYDVIFSNWLMMYLTDEEVHNLAVTMLKWLKKDGFVFFRESCYGGSGNIDISFKPTLYRPPAFYNALFHSVGYNEKSEGRSHVFQMIFNRSIQAFVKLRRNQNQYCWLLQKSEEDVQANHGYETFQKFQNNRQYSRNGIKLYEKVFGDGYVSTGGPETTEEFVGMLNLKKGQKVLDVACGIGGGDFYMAQKYGVEVTGMDLSSNMVEIAMERLTHYTDLLVQFEIADVTKRDYSPESFDVIYSRDTILHIKDKPALFVKFLTWLKPGGKLLISDYCCGELPHTEVFQQYVAQRGYNLCTPQGYGKLMESAGFVNVKAEDRSRQFTEMLIKEKKVMNVNMSNFIQDSSEKDYQDLLNDWSNKLVHLESGNQKWSLIYAEKSEIL